MSYTEKNGYIPRSFDDIIETFRLAYNDEFDADLSGAQFKGTNIYKYLYMEAQELAKTEGSIANLGAKLVDYIRYINAKIILPKSTTDGIIAHLKEDLGLDASLKPITQVTAGQAFIAVDVDPNADDFEDTAEDIYRKLADYCTSGLYYNGEHRGTVVALNGQPFEYAFDHSQLKTFNIKLDITLTENKNVFVPTPQAIADIFRANFANRYKFGWDFEPDVYLTCDDLPFAGNLVVSYSTPPEDEQEPVWITDIYKADYREKIVLGTFTTVIDGVIRSGS